MDVIIYFTPIGKIIIGNFRIIDYNFEKEGIYPFEIVFNNIINNIGGIFYKCSNINSSYEVLDTIPSSFIIISNILSVS